MKLTDDLRIEPDELTATAGTITFFLNNTGSFPTHNFNIGTSLEEPVLVGTRQIPAGQKIVFTVEDLPAGTYVIWCDVHDHHEAGMIGTLTVTP